MEFAIVDEIIIDFVRDNKCLYDKSDINIQSFSIQCIHYWFNLKT